MTRANIFPPDPKLDLVLERVADMVKGVVDVRRRLMAIGG